jgi:hypothetical protein
VNSIGGRRFDEPDDIRVFPLGRLDIIHLGYMTISRSKLEPGWRWSEHVKPIVGTESCQQHHRGYLLSGRMGVRMDDGRTFEYGPGDAYEVLPGHDSWTVGDELLMTIEFSPGTADLATLED